MFDCRSFDALYTVIVCDMRRHIERGYRVYGDELKDCIVDVDKVLTPNVTENLMSRVAQGFKLEKCLCEDLVVSPAMRSRLITTYGNGGKGQYYRIPPYNVVSTSDAVYTCLSSRMNSESRGSGQCTRTLFGVNITIEPRSTRVL